MEIKNYYKILGVSSTASLEDIKIAYRKLSKKFHPDINDGDKFFEEKFKEVQEAYEILTDVKKKKDYDFKFRNNFNSSSFDKKKHEDYVRKREEEFEKQKETFKKWEESLKKKEQDLKSIKPRKIYLFYVVIIVIVGSFFLFNTFYKSGKDANENNFSVSNATVDSTISVENVPIVDTAISIATIDTAIFVKNNQIVDTTISLKVDQTERNSNSVLMTLLHQSKFAKILEGSWYGKALQFNINETWDLRFSYNPENAYFNIYYPSLDCSGVWKIENISNESIDFREYISKGNCIHGGLVKLKVRPLLEIGPNSKATINNDKIEFNYYSPNSTILDSKGTLTKEK